MKILEAKNVLLRAIYMVCDGVQGLYQWSFVSFASIQQHFQSQISTLTGQNSLSLDIHVPQRMIPNDEGKPAFLFVAPLDQHSFMTK